MTRKRIKHAQIPDESKRNTIFGRRTEGFLKKANEFAILCGVDMGVLIIPKQDGENNAVMWPSPTNFRDRLQKFLDFPNVERTRKMVSHKKFIERIIAAETDSLLKLEERVHLKESHQLMNQVMQGKRLDELDLRQLDCLSSFSVRMLERLEKREAELSNEPCSARDVGAMMSLSPPTLFEDLRNDQWFIESMSCEQIVTNFFGMSSNNIMVSGGGGGVAGSTN